MKSLYITFVFLFAAIAAWCQQGTVKGTLFDTAAKQPVSDATVSVLDAKDSSLVTFTRSNPNGMFEVKYLNRGNYRLLITHVAYRNQNRLIAIETSVVDVGYIPVTSKASMLEEVTLSQEKAPVTIKHDTVEYNAGSFRTKPGAVVEDLLKKLPGVKVDKDGKIKAHGEEVKKMLVDGKPFFGNDPKIASKNLPADAIDKVQVFDKKSDQAEFTGFDDGNSEKTINLTLKEDKKHGVFGKASAAAGNNDRYEGSFNMNSFKGEKQFSAIGMANNVNKQGFSFGDLFQFSGGFGKGGDIEINGAGLPIQDFNSSNNSITTTWAGGINFNDVPNPKLELGGSYFYSRMQDEIVQNSKRQYLFTDNPFIREQDAIVENIKQQHRLNLNADQKIDSFNSIKFTTSFELQDASQQSENSYSTVSLAGKLLNDGSSFVTSNTSGFNWNSSLLWRHRFKKKGRTFSADLNLGLNDGDYDGSLRSFNSFYNESSNLINSDSINQVNLQAREETNFGSTFSYTEPLSKNSLLEFSYGFSHAIADNRKETFDIHFQSKDSTINNLLSNDFSNKYQSHRASIGWKYQPKNWNIATGFALQGAALTNKFHNNSMDSVIDRSYLNLLPYARIQYIFNKFKNLRLNYTTHTRQPDAYQLNPIADNSDPLNIRLGNPNLAPEYVHRVQLHYHSHDPFRHTGFFSMINLSMRNNSFAIADLITERGIRTTYPINVDGTYSIDGNANWSFPIRFMKSSISFNTNVYKSKNINLLNGEENRIDNWNIGEEISLNFYGSKSIDFNAGARISFNDVQYSLGRQQSTQYWNQEYFMDADVQLPAGFSVNTAFVFTKNTGYATGFNTDVALWNAGASKYLFKNKRGEISFRVYDILNENAGISRNANQNYIEDVYSKVLNRFWLLSFTYKLNKFPGKGGFREDIKVITR